MKYNVTQWDRNIYKRQLNLSGTSNMRLNICVLLYGKEVLAIFV